MASSLFSSSHIMASLEARHQTMSTAKHQYVQLFLWVRPLECCARSLTTSGRRPSATNSTSLPSVRLSRPASSILSPPACDPSQLYSLSQLSALEDCNRMASSLVLLSTLKPLIDHSSDGYILSTSTFLGLPSMSNLARSISNYKYLTSASMQVSSPRICIARPFPDTQRLAAMHSLLQANVVVGLDNFGHFAPHALACAEGMLG